MTLLSNVIDLPSVEDRELAPDETRAICRRLVILLRRNIRQVAGIQSAYRDTARQHRRTAAKLRKDGTPFDRARIDQHERLAKSHSSASREVYGLLKRNARLLLDMAPAIDACSTLAERCELLNVNVADRGGLTEEDGIISLIYVHRLEDSAEHRGEDFHDSPLFRAVMEVMIDFLTETPEGQAIGDSLWEPGGMFEQVPRYQMNGAGTLERMPPRLRVIEAGAEGG